MIAKMKRAGNFTFRYVIKLWVMTRSGGFKIERKILETFELVTFSRKTFSIQVVGNKESYQGRTLILTLNSKVKSLFLPKGPIFYSERKKSGEFYVQIWD